MSIKRIDGTMLEAMLKNGLASIRLKEKELNDLNVFPVADGDTGTNMCLTLQSGIMGAQSNRALGVYLNSLSQAMLLGARGNSGTILSQLFKGMAIELSKCQEAGIGHMRNALIRAYRTAYRAVVKPVEGTILTVAREGIELIRTQINRQTPIEVLLSMYIAQMRKTLSTTKDMLSVLKESDVIDAGGAGYIAIFDGMLKYLYGEELTDASEPVFEEPSALTQQTEIDITTFNENSSFEYGYCMEFVLQLMNSWQYNRRFRLESFIAELATMGESLVATQDGKRVKVHLHTFKPSRVIAVCQDYGEFIVFKLENMQIQHNLLKRGKKPVRSYVPLGIVAVLNGEGLERLYTDLGCSIIIDGGEKLNPSGQDFISAFEQLNCDSIAVLVNNKNSLMAARQAAEQYKGARVCVLPSNNVMQGYYALCMDIADSTDCDYRLKQMTEAISSTHSLLITEAARPYSENGIQCRKGDSICIKDDELVFSAGNDIDAIIGGLRSIESIELCEACVIFRGNSVSPQQEEGLIARLNEVFPCMEVNMEYGGQSVYSWIVGLL